MALVGTMQFYCTPDPIYGSEYKTTKFHLVDAHHSESTASNLFIDYVRYIYIMYGLLELGVSNIYYNNTMVYILNGY